jgi:hypothetical protein
VPITRCPGCNESLEVPAVVPGGLVACPYCGEEFVPSGGGGRPRGGARRGRDHDDYDDGYGRPRGSFRKKTDPVPIVLGIVAVLVLGGAGIFFMVKKTREDNERQQAFYARVAATPSVSFPMPPAPPPPDSARAPFDLPTVYKENDLVTLMDLSYSSGINEWKNGKQLTSTYPGLSYSVRTEEHGERVTASDGSTSTHEGHYLVPSYVWGLQTVLSNKTVDATFKLNRQGLVVPGTFRQTGGDTITPPPEFIADRGRGALPDKPVLLYEVWGTARLDTTLARALVIDGRTLESIPAQRQRVGGWRIATGTLETKEADGSWTNKAALDLRLYAVENGIVRNFSYQGQPAELSFAAKWTGEAEYMLQSQILVRVGNLKTVIEAQVKTRTDVYRWSGQTTADMKLYKDP